MSRWMWWEDEYEVEVKKAVKAIDRREEGGRELMRGGEEMRDDLVAFLKDWGGLGL
ncbi:hypothetical protein B0H16DRAFT_1593537 [Mycena metata]|uniref:Uncharacterized protein n=1 Tax=Mycena metata TaxID=1033252 RepID=A0AAD7HQN2_9AGAR|nr:hypothetical protein B0H16DRAFT_1593537 [Mycena metata]